MKNKMSKDALSPGIALEWSPAKKWNPFNSYKLLAQVYRWRLIRQGDPIPQPGLVTVDPINSCNLSCNWCNAGHILRHRHDRISKEALLDLPRQLKKWQGSPEWPAGVEAVCIAGGGEPLLHPDISAFIEACVANGVEVGVVTNGTVIQEHIEALSLCTWVGVSVDAGSAKVFHTLKGKDYFYRVCENIQMLNDYIRGRKCRLGTNRPGYGVSYKYLLFNGNVSDLYPAASLAKELGCKNFHVRPAGVPWDRLDQDKKSLFAASDKTIFSEQIEQARHLEDDNFGVYGITHKFDEDLNRANFFSACSAVFMTCVFMPPRTKFDEDFCVSLCCDRRGDDRLEFSGPISSFNQFKKLWGSTEHWEIKKAIRLKDCPRCTYQPHNQIFEHVICNDSMTFKFI